MVMAAPNDFNMDQSASTSANHHIGDSRLISGSVPPLAVSEWDLLLKKLGFTDIEALTAVREGTEASQLITRFVRGQFRQHFVPEDVLLAVKMQSGVARQVLIDLRMLSCSKSSNPHS